MTHEHKFNGTVIGGKLGRCVCGVWARYDRATKTYYGLVNPTTAKGLETRLKRFQDPEEPYPKHAISPIEPEVVEDKEPDTTPAVDQVLSRTRKPR